MELWVHYFDPGNTQNLGRVKEIIKDVEVNEKRNKMQHGLTKEILCYFHYTAMMLSISLNKGNAMPSYPSGLKYLI